MANTTENERTDAQRDQDVLVSAKNVTKKDVVNAYVSGKNYYDLAEEFFGFTSEDAVNRIRGIVESEVEQN